jgi:hypothetical protein
MSPLPPGGPKVKYSATLAADGGNAPYKWSISSGKLPMGLKLNKSAGTISGKPKQSGTFTFTLEVIDRKTKEKPHTQNTAAKTLSIIIS